MDIKTDIFNKLNGLTIPYLRFKVNKHEVLDVLFYKIRKTEREEMKRIFD